VSYNNRLVDSAGNPLPHAMPVDTSLHWANSPAGWAVSRQCLWLRTRHGGDNQYLSDACRTAGTRRQCLSRRLFSTPYLYANTQEADISGTTTTRWGSAPQRVHGPPRATTSSRRERGTALIANHVLPGGAFRSRPDAHGPAVHGRGRAVLSGRGTRPTRTRASPTHLPEFFGDVILVNGKAWPVLDSRAPEVPLQDPERVRFARVLTSRSATAYRSCTWGRSSACPPAGGRRAC
jgi:spore coat protein A